MPGFSQSSTYVDAKLAGKTTTATFRKNPSQASIANWWFDLSMTSGTPPPNYYAATPLKAAVLNPLRGIFHGDAVSPEAMFLERMLLLSANTEFLGEFRLLDYLLYYPTIDLDETGIQEMDNTVTLPRYADGDGVMAMFVCQAPTVAPGGQGVFTYVDADGVTQTSPMFQLSTTLASIGLLLTTEPAVALTMGPFLALAGNCKGIRSVTSLTMYTPCGGLGALVLVRPLDALQLIEVGTPVEKTYFDRANGPPRIYDGAYLNLIACCAGSIATRAMVGSLSTVWT